MNDKSIVPDIINLADNSREIYRTTSCNLQITLDNQTGNAIPLSKDNELKIKISGVTVEELKAATITLADWTLDIKTVVSLKCMGKDGAKWEKGQKLTISIKNLRTNAQPGEKKVQINLLGSTFQSMSSQLFTSVVISDPPKLENGNLRDVLQLTLDDGGVVYTSPKSESESGIQKLENGLHLNIKNIGSAALYTGTKVISPQIEVTFLYGGTIGCLTSASEEEGGAYANEISATPRTPANYPWMVEKTKGDPRPKWIFKCIANQGRKGLIGINADSNITFSFEKIVVATPVGHTQMLVHFSGFWKDDNTAYDDALFVIDIQKKEPPKERGIINFYSETPCITVNKPGADVQFELKWTTYYTDKVDVFIHSSVADHREIKYPVHHLPLLKDSTIITLEGVLQDTVYLITIQAYDRSGAFLNSKQFSVIAKTTYFTDPRDGKTYPTIKVGNLLWMSEDLKYVISNNSLSVEKRKPHRVYNWEAAQSPAILTGWRLPTREDWQKLINAQGGSPYERLIEGGNSGFNAVLNGRYIGGNSVFFDAGAYYWAKDEKGDEVECVLFVKNSKEVRFDKVKKPTYISVRYVKELGEKENDKKKETHE